MTKLSTLCYIEKDDKYLMLHRTVKENDVNKDKWIGVGGHFEYGESPEECLLREVKEETGYTLTSWAYRGIVTFVYGEDVVEYMSLYTADGFEGEPIDCDEGELEWVEKSKIETLKLWEIAAALDNPNDTTVASCLATCATEFAATAALPI